MLNLNFDSRLQDMFDLFYCCILRYIQRNSLSLGSKRNNNETEDMIGNNGLISDKIMTIGLNLLKRSFFFDEIHILDGDGATLTNGF